MPFGHAWSHHRYIHLPKFSGNLTEKSHSRYPLSIIYSPSVRIHSSSIFFSTLQYYESAQLSVAMIYPSGTIIVKSISLNQTYNTIVPTFDPTYIGANNNSWLFDNASYDTRWAWTDEHECWLLSQGPHTSSSLVDCYSEVTSRGHLRTGPTPSSSRD